MRALVQRVSSARVVVDGAVTGEIGNGLLVFICAMRGDTEKESE
ncbi:D-Tyr-tRNAtyr deacylase [Shinella fusca]|uniref:D-Tyr-tRNAtyr deacylase n=1 Tax=Shinella fusca TaxID=544480 RepID=A0A7W7YU59_9HYPH|nr:D-Tyr-tRNAtyr deacylase [Shinella fusca]